MPKPRPPPPQRPTQIIVSGVQRIKVPIMYEVWDNGVYEVTGEVDASLRPSLGASLPWSFQETHKRITPTPIWTSGFAEDDNKDRMVELSFIPLQGPRVSLWVSADVLASSRTITQLSRKGLQVDSTNSDALIRYLAAMQAANRNATLGYVSSRFGEIHREGQRIGYLLGKKWIGNPMEAIAPSPLFQGPFDGAFEQQGDPNVWIAAFDSLRKLHPIWRLTLSASFAAPLMSIKGIDQRTFIYYLWGKTTKGKSAAQRLALSAWGNPTKLALSFNSTQIGLTEPGAHFTGGPILVDEREALNEKKISIREWIYGICDEHIRTRAQKIGGLQAKPQFRLLIMSNGERRLIEDDTGGQATRTLEVSIRDVVAIPDPEGIHGIATNNFGFAATVFLEELYEAHKADPTFNDKLVRDYEKMKIELAQESINNTREDVRRVAVICLADVLVSQILLGESYQDAWRAAVKAGAVLLSTLDRENADASLRGCDVLAGHIASFPGNYARGGQTEIRVCHGQLTKDELHFCSFLIDPLLISRKIDPASFWMALKDLNVLKVDGRHLKAYRTINGERQRVYVVDRKKFYGLIDGEIEAAKSGLAQVSVNSADLNIDELISALTSGEKSPAAKA